MTGSRKARENRKVRAVPRLHVGLFLLALATPAWAADRPFQVAYVGLDAPDLTALYRQAADIRVQRGLAKTQLPTATPEHVAQWTDAGALQAFRECAATSAPQCQLPPPLDRFQMVVTLTARPTNDETLYVFTLAAFDEQGRRQVTRSRTDEPGFALAYCEEEAQTLPLKFAPRTSYDVPQPLPVVALGTVTSVAGAGAVGAGVFLLRDAAMADARLRAKQVGSYAEAQALARDGDLKQKVGIGALAVGVVAVVAGGWVLYEGLTPEAVPAILPTPGGLAVVFSGRWP